MATGAAAAAGLEVGLLPGMTVTVTTTSSVTTTLSVTTACLLRSGELKALAAKRAPPRIAKRIL